MTQAELSRRLLLKFFAGGALLPLAGQVRPATGARAASTSKMTPKTVEFISMRAPASDAERATTFVDSQLLVNYSDETKEAFTLQYQPLFLTGDRVPDGESSHIAGGYHDIHGNPIIDPTAPGKTQFFSDCPDGYSLLTLEKTDTLLVTGNPVFAVVQFEYTTRAYDGSDVYKQLPAPMAVLTLDQDPQTGQLRLVRYSPIDTSRVHGVWTTCGASLSPWNTHLSSEEYEPDAVSARDDDTFKAYSRNLYGDETTANPYHYGHVPEVTVNPDGTGSIVKHYCLGRISHEVVQVMPDQRTALMGDDATNGGLFMFIADKAADLSAGTLYVAQVKQHPGVDLDKGGRFDLKWISLGHASSEEIKALADKLTAADILEVAKTPPDEDGFEKIRYSGSEQWVKIKPGMEKAAAFLETHRYAPLVGATLAFTKMEGTSVNARDKIAYSAMSYIYKSMSDGKNPIQVEQIRAGAVYALPMAGGQTDLSGAPIDSDWVPVSMAAIPALVGRDLEAPDAIGNTAAVDSLANPDNLKFSERTRTLFIGEDSGCHVNNFLWAYNVDNGKLSRLLSCPAGAESTGLHAVDDIHGYAYIMSNFQHAGDWEAGLHDKVKDRLAPLIDSLYRNRRSAAVGYLQALPSSTS